MRYWYHDNLRHFPSLSTYFNLKATLIRLVIFTTAYLGSCCRTSPVMRSNPSAFLGFIFFFISSLISVIISFPVWLPCGWNICSRVSANRCAFVQYFWPTFHLFSWLGNLNNRSFNFFGCLPKRIISIIIVSQFIQVGTDWIVFYFVNFSFQFLRKIV